MSGPATCKSDRLDAGEERAKLRRLLDKLGRDRFSGWVFVSLEDGSAKHVSTDESAVVDTEHPIWPSASAAVSVDSVLSTVAGCQRDRTFGRLSIPMRDGVIVSAPQRRLGYMTRLLP